MEELYLFVFYSAEMEKYLIKDMKIIQFSDMFYCWYVFSIIMKLFHFRCYFDLADLERKWYEDVKLFSLFYFRHVLLFV